MYLNWPILYWMSTYIVWAGAVWIPLDTEKEHIKPFGNVPKNILQSLMRVLFLRVISYLFIIIATFSFTISNVSSVFNVVIVSAMSFFLIFYLFVLWYVRAKFIQFSFKLHFSATSFVFSFLFILPPSDLFIRFQFTFHVFIWPILLITHV